MLPHRVLGSADVSENTGFLASKASIQKKKKKNKQKNKKQKTKTKQNKKIC
jgi:hypothetical protein